MKWFGLPVDKNDEQKRFDNICKKIFTGAYYHNYMQWIRNGVLQVNNKKPVFKQRVVAGDYICIAEPIITYLHDSLLDNLVAIDKHTKIDHKPPENIDPINIYEYINKDKIIYCNDDILVLNKYAGESIFHGRQSITEMLSQVPNHSLSFKPAPCHRLDTGTSGILMCGLSIQGTRLVNTIQKQSKIHKCYVALLSQPIIHARLMHYLYRNDRMKKTLAVSHHIPPNQSKQHTFLGPATLFAHSYGELKLSQQYRTAQQKYLYPTFILLDSSGGKTHQIRSQCLANNTPLFGDVKYTGYTHAHAHNNFFLHASTYLSEVDDSMSHILPKAFQCTMPQSWYGISEVSSHDLLFRFDRGLELLGKRWEETSFSEESTDITALCTSVLGGVMG